MRTSKYGESDAYVRESNTLSWKPCQGDSLNLPDHRNVSVIRAFLFLIIHEGFKKTFLCIGTLTITWDAKDVFSTWMAFRGNTRDLGSFGEETDEITDLHQILEEVLLTARGDGVAGKKRRRRDPSGDDVRDFVTASGRGRLNEDLESST
ncbi:hypothetical protein Tco_0064338 [Tanacetum coccineum]